MMYFDSENELNFEGENLQDQSFQDYPSSLENAKFQGANLQEANLQGLNLYRAKFQGANLRDANLQSAILREAQFQGADLRDANLQSADLHESSFKGAKLHGANLKECKDWYSSDWTKAEYDKTTKFPSDFNPDNQELIKTRRRGQYVTKKSGNLSITQTDTEIQTALTELRKFIQKRQGQEKFRKKLIEAYQGRCAITGCEIKGVLEAAHVKPYCISKDNSLGNGILLRSDFHTLFDLNLIRINPKSKEIEVHPILLCNDNYYYEQFNNIPLRAYEEGIGSPDANYLEWRYQNYGRCIGESLQEYFL
ncbi:pentapeptide repeat-containing protein [Trichocoleus sp. ST-U3]